MTSAHRATLWFLRGGLVAGVGLLLPTQVGFLAAGTPLAGMLAATLRVIVPAAAFGVGGLIGATALHRGSRASVGFGGGFFLAGCVVALTSPLLQGLSGFENLPTVLFYATGSTAAAFALAGATVGFVVEPGRWLALSGALALGGIVGGAFSVLPALISLRLAGWLPEVQLFVRLACSLVGLLAPFAVAGATAGRLLARE